MAAVISRMAKRKKEHDGDDNVSLSHNKKPRVVWTPHLHSKFLDAVHLLGLHEAVPRKIVALMNVEGITREHVASHLQKYRLGKKKAINRVPSTMILEPTQSHTQSYNFPLNQTSTFLLPNKNLVLHQSHMSGVAPTTLIQSQNINNSLNIYPPPSTYPMYHHTFPTLVNQSTTPPGFPTPKSTSIWDYDWHLTHNSLPVLVSHKTSQNTQVSSQQTQPIIVGSSSLDYNCCYDNSPIDFSVEETNCNTLKDLANMSRNVEEEDLMNVWRCFEEEEYVTNVMQPLGYEAPQQTSKSTALEATHCINIYN